MDIQLPVLLFAKQPPLSLMRKSLYQKEDRGVAYSLLGRYYPKHLDWGLGLTYANPGRREAGTGKDAGIDGCE